MRESSTCKIFYFVWKGQDVLGATLDTTSPVSDKRLLIALDLFIASQYDHLQQSQFLAKLTILDTLAVSAKCSESDISWIEEKIKEASDFDGGLKSALTNLKYQSRTSAIKALVSRAVLSQGGSAMDAHRYEALVDCLYKARSRMSHSGYTGEVNLGGATQLARLVLNFAIKNRSILDIA